MKPATVTCPLCGTQFDPLEHAACQTCPLQPGCQLVCCPVCGYQTVDVEKSTLARLAGRVLASQARERTTLSKSRGNRLEAG
ncbi:MAG TPA: hypothetical protein VE136_08630 [Anaerolineales bacterium]|jgi:uncharacterized protein (DUF2225 family)|nr:hypothetical protein [Anaerolineales bacterium]